jgi:hypothetical protein
MVRGSEFDFLLCIVFETRINSVHSYDSECSHPWSHIELDHNTTFVCKTAAARLNTSIVTLEAIWPASKLAAMPKRGRLLALGMGPHISQTALQALLEQVRDEGVPDAISRSTFRRQRRQVSESMTDFGPILQKVSVPLTEPVDNDELCFDMWVQHPLAMLQQAAEDHPGFRDLLLHVFDSAGQNLRIVIYNDEIDPGAKLAARHARKVEVVYWSLLDFGYPVLSHENAWFELFAVRSDLRKNVEGGMSHLLLRGLRFFFWSTTCARLA